MIPAAFLLLLAGGLSGPAAAPEPAPRIRWRECPTAPAVWYGSAEARRIAENVLLFQRCSGGWPKNVEMAAPLDEEGRARVLLEKADDDATIDNAATTTELRFLARVFAATRSERFRASFLAGLAYLLGAQYPNGGWPQFHPLRKDYSRYITFNDDAMVNVMTLLREVAAGKPPFDLVDLPTRDRCAWALQRGVEVILWSQVRTDGVPTAWCAQVDPVTLEPRGARSYEHPSLSGRESVGIVRFLMGIERPSPDVVAAVDGALAWFRRVRIMGIRLAVKPAPGSARGFDLHVEKDPAAPPLWARFYELGTERPIFSGRDGVVTYDLSEIEIERRTGYSWIGPYAASLLETEAPAFRKRVLDGQGP